MHFGYSNISRSLFFAVALVLLSAGLVVADVKLPAVIGDNMVLQRGMKVPIWGWAEPGEQIVVKFGLSSMAWAATADADGKWVARIGPFETGGPFDLTIEANNTIVVKNILVGEVWVCSGQSNMEWPVNQSANAEQEIAEANYANIRLFTVSKKVSQEPLEDCRGRWRACNSDTVQGFSAVGYFFGRYLHQDLGVPVGLINTSWGGTPAEAWTSREYLEMDDDFKPMLERYEEAAARYPELKQKYERQMKKFEETAAKLKAEGKQVPRRPRGLAAPMGPDHQNSPTGLYNAMILPIVPYAIRGAIWYQGESNASRAYQYRELFPAMIMCWRQTWRQGDFPFLFVQLANFMEAKSEPTESEWAELREAQLMTLTLPRTGMAVTIDIGQADDIHPKNKRDVGKRLALWTLAETYSRDVVYSGPLYESMDIDGDKITLHFEHVGDGLVARGDQLQGFAIAGADRKFVWADAKIQGDTVMVSSDEVAEPVAVRYGWANNPVCSLYNADGLPASPFRTDMWPGLTAGRR